jgi:hypothetical protein
VTTKKLSLSSLQISQKLISIIKKAGLLKGSLGWLAKFRQTRKSGGYGKIISNKLKMKI